MLGEARIDSFCTAHVVYTVARYIVMPHRGAGDSFGSSIRRLEGRLQFFKAFHMTCTRDQNQNRFSLLFCEIFRLHNRFAVDSVRFCRSCEKPCNFCVGLYNFRSFLLTHRGGMVEGFFEVVDYLKIGDLTRRKDPSIDM